jgi:hypothetical protein
VRTFRKLAAAAASLALLVSAARVASSSDARSDGLSVAETESLLRGTTIVRPIQLERAGRRYVGGVSYVVVDAAVERVAGLLGDVGSWQRILPKTRAADVVGSAGDDDLVLVTHGTALLQASYTMRVHREGRLVRFWMDPGRRHDIEDAWGFLRVEPLGDEQSGQTVLTYGVLVDLGPGLLRDLFEDRVRQLALTVPDRVRWMMVARSAAGQRASR